MTNEQLQEIREEEKGYIRDYMTTKSGKTYFTVRAAVKEIDRLTAELATLREENRWISVNERLPEEQEKVLMFYHDGEQYVCTFTGEWFRKFKLWDFIQPTHWRPLPAPPKEEAE